MLGRGEFDIVSLRAVTSLPENDPRLASLVVFAQSYASSHVGAESLKQKLQEREAQLDSYRTTVATLRETEHLRAENEMLKKQEKGPSAIENNRYVNYIRQLNDKMAELQRREDEHKKVRQQYEILYGRYEMLRIQYVRLRTHRMRPTPVPDFIAGRPHPCDRRKRYVTNLAKLRDTEKAIKSTTHGKRYPSKVEEDYGLYDEHDEPDKNDDDDDDDDDVSDSEIDGMGPTASSLRTQGSRGLAKLTRVAPLEP